MPTPTIPDLVAASRLSELSSIYDVFAEAYSDAQAAGVEAGINARTAAERQPWAARGLALADFRRSIDPDDRLAVIKAIVMLGSEVDAIRGYLDRGTAPA